MKIIDSKLQGNVLQEFTADYFEKHKELIKYVKEETEKLLTLTDVSSMFSAKQMKQAFDDGVKAEKDRCGEFDIENYC